MQDELPAPGASPVNSIVKLNLIVGSLCLLSIGSLEAVILWRLFLCRQANLSW